MTSKQATRLIATSFLISVAILAWRSLRASEAPPPGAFTYPTALYGGAALIADLGAPGFAAVLSIAVGIGIVFQLIAGGSAAPASRRAAGPAPRARRDGRSGQPSRRQIGARKG